MSESNKVQRWDLVEIGPAYHKRTEMDHDDEYGNWVTYEDYAALQQKLDAVLAENVALKDINAWCHTEAFQNMYREFKTAEAIGCHDVDCMRDAMLTAIMHAPKTPATDAYLNSVRADAIDEFGKYHNFSEKLFIQHEAKKYAERLRAVKDGK